MTAELHGAGDERFADWVDGCMSVRDRERFEAEMRVNPALRERVEQYRRTVETVQRALRAPVVEVDVAAAVLARIESGEVEPVATPRVPWRGASQRALWWSAAAAAAVFALLALLVEWKPVPEGTEVARAANEQAPGEQGAQIGAPALGALSKVEDQPGFDDEKLAADLGAAASADRAAGEGGADDDEPSGRKRAAPPAEEKRGGEQQDRLADVGTRVQQLRDGDQTGTVAGADPADRLRELLERGTRLETAQTMLPQVLLQRQSGQRFAYDKPAAAPHQSKSSGARSRQGDSFFQGVAREAPDLMTVLPSGSLQIQRLNLPPQVVGNVVTTDDRAAWLVEGHGPEVFEWLARLSDLSRAEGYEIANSEVPTEYVLAQLPAAPTSASRLAAERAKDDLRSESYRPPQPGANRRGAPALGGKAAEPRPSGPPAAGEDKAESPRSRADQPVDETGAIPSSSTAAAQPGAPEPAPAPAAPTVRLVVVIDRAERPSPSRR